MSITPPSTISSVPSLIQSTTGAATGINWSSIISQLMAVQQQPITALQNQQSLAQQKDTIYTNLQNSLLSLQTSADSLRQLGGNALNGSAAVSSTPTVASATAKSGALMGTVSLDVLNLAAPATVTSTAALDSSSATQASAPVISSAANITSGGGFDPTASLASQAADLVTPASGGGSFTVNGSSIAWTSGDSLQTVLGRINSANAGVVASYNSGTGKVSLTGSSTGSAAALAVADNSGGLLATLGISAGSATGTDSTSFDPTQPLATQSAFLDTPVSAGTMTVNGVVFTIDPATQSLNDVMRSIYGSNAGVQGLYDSTDGTLSLTTKNSGSSAQMQLGASGDTSNFLAAMKLGAVNAGQDAKVTVNGGSALSLPSNSSTALLPGANVTLQGLGSTTITVSPDATTAAADMTAMVAAYNSAVQAVSTQLNQAPASSSASSSSTSSNPLQGAFIGDPLLQRTQDLLTTTVVNTRMSSGQTRELSQLGLTLTSASPGAPQTLTFDQNTFIAAYQSDPTGVQALVAGNGTGVADNLYQAINGLVDPTSGAYTLQLQGDTKSEGDLGTEITNMQAQLTQQQTAMQTQYANLEATLGAMQAQASQLSGTFAAMAAGTYS